MWQMGYCALCYFSHLYFRLSLASLHQHVFERLFRGKDVSLLQDFVKQFIEEKLSSLWFVPAINYLNELKKKGAIIVIFSNSPAFLVKSIAVQIGIEEAIGTEYEIDKEGRLRGVGEVVDGEKKRWLLKRAAFSSGSYKTYAFSDSCQDLPFLEAASDPIAVNPKPSLRKLAQKRGWEIL